MKNQNVLYPPEATPATPATPATATTPTTAMPYEPGTLWFRSITFYVWNIVDISFGEQTNKKKTTEANEKQTWRTNFDDRRLIRWKFFILMDSVWTLMMHIET